MQKGFITVILFLAFFALPTHAEVLNSQPSLTLPLILTVNLSQGSEGTDVVLLQQFLQKYGYFTYPTITGYFGPVTKQAVINFQITNQINPIGIVGPITRAKIAEFIELVRRNGSPRYHSSNDHDTDEEDPIDTDGDSVSDSVDNCPSVSNPSQTDDDVDGIGDACDVPESFTLTVYKTGIGTGVVTSSPAGINCGATCLAIFENGSFVDLSAAAAFGSVFSGWSGGGCSGTGSCVVNMSTSSVVTATFTSTDDEDPEVSFDEEDLGDRVYNGEEEPVIDVIATDNIGVTGAQFYINNVAFGAMQTGPSFAVTLPTGTLEDADYQLDVVVHDAAGNYATSTTSFRIDTIPMEIEFLNPRSLVLAGDGIRMIIQFVYINFNETEEGLVVNWLVYREGSEEAPIFEGTGNTVFDLLETTEGAPYVFKAYVTGLAGLPSNLLTQTVTVVAPE